MVKFYLFLGLMLSSTTSFAQAQSVVQNILSSYGCSQNSFVCKAINENINRDTNMCRVLPSYIESLGNYIQKENPRLTYLKVADRIRYLGPVHGQYSYEYNKLKSGRFNITARMHFKNLDDYSEQEIHLLREKFRKAAAIWNRNNPFHREYQFDFQIAPKRTPQSVSAELVRFQTRGPYFDRWSTRWNEYTIAHEFGHVMGLFDEYEYFHNDSGGADCDLNSIMCSSYGSPKNYHYHLILQRAFCEV